MFQKVFLKKNCTPTGIPTPYLMLESQLLYQLGYMCFVVSNGMLLSFFAFNLLQSANRTPSELVVINLKWADNGFMVLGN